MAAALPFNNGTCQEEEEAYILKNKAWDERWADVCRCFVLWVKMRSDNTVQSIERNVSFLNAFEQDII